MKLEIAEASIGPYKGNKIVGISEVRFRDKTIVLSIGEAKELTFKLLTLVAWEKDKGYYYEELELSKILVPLQRGDMIEITGFTHEKGAFWCKLDEAFILAMDLLQLLIFKVGIYVDKDCGDY